MKWLNLVSATTLGFSGANTLAAGFTLDDLHKSAKVGVETFKKDVKEEVFKTVYGYQVSAKNEGSKVKIYFKRGQDAASMEYFCHYHEKDEMDCHEL